MNGMQEVVVILVEVDKLGEEGKKVGFLIK